MSAVGAHGMTLNRNAFESSPAVGDLSSELLSKRTSAYVFCLYPDELQRAVSERLSQTKIV